MGVHTSQVRYILDAGAHVGYATVQLAYRFPLAKIVAVEADPDNYAALVRNTAAFPNVVPVRRDGSQLILHAPNACCQQQSNVTVGSKQGIHDELGFKGQYRLAEQ